MADYIVNGKKRYHNYDPENSPFGYPGQREEMEKANIFKRFWTWIKDVFSGVRKIKFRNPFKRKKKMTPSEIIESVTLQLPNKDYTDQDNQLFNTTFWRPKGMGDIDFIYKLEHQTAEGFKKSNKDVREFIAYMKSVDGVYYPYEMEYFHKINEILNDPFKMSGLGKIINRMCICFHSMDKKEKQEYENLLTKVFLAFNVTQDLMKVNSDMNFNSSVNNFVNLNNVNMGNMNGKEIVLEDGTILEIKTKK